jgi:hypothetical protein
MRLVTLTLAAFLAVPAAAHEFWLDPRSDGDTGFTVDFRVGEGLKGTAYPYLSDRARQLWMSSGDGLFGLRPRIGDMPAVTVKSPPNGITVIGYQSAPSRLTYKSFDKFQRFVVAEGLSSFIEAHRDRDLPETGFSELYSRYAKTAIVTGAGASGLPRTPSFWFDLEMLTPPSAETVAFRLSLDGKPLANHAVHVLTVGGRVRHISDDVGLVEVSGPINAPVLLSAVWMEPINTDDAVWHSHWASYALGPAISHNHAQKNAAER